MKAPINVSATAQAWAALVEQIGIVNTIRDDSELARAVALLDALLDAIRAVEGSPLESLVALISDLIESYETSTYGEPEASPAEVLRELMAANDLKQADLARELGGQSVVSAILSGHRTINARQAGLLGQRFKLSPAVFIAKPTPAALHAAPAHMVFAATEVLLDVTSHGQPFAPSTRAKGRVVLVEMGDAPVERDTATDEMRVDVATLPAPLCIH